MQCHMPSRGTEIRHAAITDHRIPRRPADAVPSEPSSPETPRTAAAIVPFQRPAERDADLRRDTALALLRAEDPETVELGEAVLRQIAVDLQDAVQQHPDDLAAWEGLGISMWRLGDPGRALQCFKASLRQAPRREFALMNAATLSAALRRSAEALQYWQQALAINPWIVRYRAETAATLASLGRWSDAETLCRETLEHFPESNRSRQVLIESLLAQRKHADADREFAAWLRFRPADPAQMRAWYENHPLRRQE
jgi:tetratricopeptide (TPR) repeat protein